MFTVQADRVLCTLARDGVYYVKKVTFNKNIRRRLGSSGKPTIFYSACI